MPANLPPEYYEAEAKYKQAVSPQEKVSALEALISTIPKHKGTDKLRAEFRRKLSKLREESAKKKKSGKGDLYTVEKHGAAQAALVGFANSGKSSLLAAVTNAHPVIAEFPMSTVMPLSGMMDYEDIQFQLVDLPPLGNETTDGWVSGILRTADMLIMVVDLSEDPDVQAELIVEQLNEWKIPVSGDDKQEKSGALMPKPLVIVANKLDIPGVEEKMELLNRAFGNDFPLISLSAKYRRRTDLLKKKLFRNSGIIRVYTKEPGKEPKMDTPFTVRNGTSVIDLAEEIHKDFVRNMKYACIWGSSRFDGQRVQKEYIFQDRDVVEYHLK